MLTWVRLRCVPVFTWAPPLTPSPSLHAVPPTTPAGALGDGYFLQWQPVNPKDKPSGFRFSFTTVSICVNDTLHFNWNMVSRA